MERGMERKAGITEAVRQKLEEAKERDEKPNLAEIGRGLGLTRRAVHYYKKKIDLEKAKARPKAAPQKAMINWKVYNESLVRRGEFLLDLEMLSQEQERLEVMNYDHRGRQYRYSDALVHFCMVVKLAFKLDYRSTEGVLRKIFALLDLPVIDYSTLCSRAGKLPEELRVYEEQEGQEIAMDSTGRSQNLRGSYRESKYQTKARRYVKLHVTVNTKTKQVQSMKVTQGKRADVKEGAGLVREANEHGKVNKAFGDAAYDDAELRGELAEGGIEAIIRLNRSRAVKDPQGEAQKIRSRLEAGVPEEERRKLLGRLNRLERTEMSVPTYDEWRDGSGYGQRAQAEGFFSREVRFFGDAVRAKSVCKAGIELLIRVSLMNLFMRLTRCRDLRELEEITRKRKQPSEVGTR